MAKKSGWSNWKPQFPDESAGRSLGHQLMRWLSFLIFPLLALALLFPGNRNGDMQARQAAQASDELRFAVTADMRYFTNQPDYFPGALAALNQLPPTQLMITPGDMDPPAGLRAVLDNTMVSNYRWYPAVGNHELPGLGSEASSGANLDWLRAWPSTYNYQLARTGPAGCPETTYSFDIAPVHFVVLNEYCDAASDTATDGDVPDALYDWLAADLAAAAQPYIFVIGHEPAFPQPDADLGGAARHLGDCLDKYPAHRDRFWALLAHYNVTAYLTGHTHTYNAIQKDGVWQIDAGHARGTGDTSFPSTFLVISVNSEAIVLRVYRGVPDYPLAHTVVLDGKHLYLPTIRR